MIALAELSKSNANELLWFLVHNFDSENPSFFNPHPFTMEALYQIIETKNKDIYILLIEDKKVIGYGMLRGMDEGYDIPTLGILIDKDCRGKGVGKQMMTVLHDVAKTNGYEKIKLHVHKDNYVARNLYNSLGYIFERYNEEAFEGTLDLKEYD